MDQQSGDTNQVMAVEEEKEQNVYSFMMNLVQEKHGDDVAFDFLEAESQMLYDIFGDALLQYFEPQLTPEQKEQFDQLIEAKEDQDALMNFLLENIDSLEEQIVNVLVKFRTDYLAGNLQSDEAAANSDMSIQ